MALGDVIARLAVSLSLETASFEKGARKAGQEVTTLQGQMTKAAKAIGGALTGMVAWEAVQQLRDWTKAAIESAGALGEQATALGVSSDALQEYRYAASQVGIESEQMDQALAQLTRRLGDATLAGKGPVVDALEKLGLTLADIKGKAAGDVIPLIADGMKRLSSDAERASVAVDLFGKAGQKLSTLLAGGAAGVNDLRKAAHDLGIVMSESDIAHADEVADKLAELNMVIEAQSNKKLLENADALLKFEQAIGDVKLALIDFSGDMQAAQDSVDDFNAMLFKWGKEHGVHDFFHALFVGVQIRDVAKAFEEATTAISLAVANMGRGIMHWVGDVLNNVWAGPLAKIKETGRAFAWLYDVVVGHSYVPDMVDGIAAEMLRLDTVMTAQAGKATSATAKKFQDLRDLLDRLFPEVGKRNQFNTDLAAIQGSAINDNAKDEAVHRLWQEFLGTNSASSRGAPDFGAGDSPLVQGMGDTEDAIAKLTEKSKIGTVQIAKSFADMAQSTLDSLSRLTQAIKGGGFLDILESALSLGLQLAGSGAFGDKAAAFVNKPVTGHAMGTASAASGLALVGERGPELVRFRGGERVYNNRETRGMMGGNVYHISGNLLTPEFWAMIQAGDAAAADAGARGGVALGQYRQSRRWRQ